MEEDLAGYELVTGYDARARDVESFDRLEPKNG